MSGPGSSLVEAGQRVPEAVETAGTAVAAASKATIEAAYIIAQRFPRSMEKVRQRLLSECQRPGFAEIARYLKPVGGKEIPGLSIRFAEAAYREMGNLDGQQQVTFDDQLRRVVKVTVRDLETNAGLSYDVVVEKTVERNSPDASREKLGERKNKRGGTVYILSATEDETLVKLNNQLAKARRNLILGFVPADIQEECERQIVATLQKQDAEDPKAALRRISDNFYNMGVDAKILETMLGHTMEAITPAELQYLRTLYQALRDGEINLASLNQAMEERDKDPKATARTRGLEGLKVRLGALDPAPKPAATDKAPAPGKAPVTEPGDALEPPAK